MTEQKYLDPKEAIRLMLDGEELVDDYGGFYAWNESGKKFICVDKIGSRIGIADRFENLRRKPQKKRRPMTRWECLAWATSDEARGWVVGTGSCSWRPPQCWSYPDGTILEFRRAKLKPDGTGIDESTITDFSVEADW
jgi:hypothetical protein